MKARDLSRGALDDDPPHPEAAAVARLCPSPEITRTSNDLLQIEEDSLYPALQRLLKEGLVKAEWQASPPIAASGLTF